MENKSGSRIVTLISQQPTLTVKNPDYILDLISQGCMNQKVGAIAAALREPHLFSMAFFCVGFVIARQPSIFKGTTL